MPYRVIDQSPLDRCRFGGIFETLYRVDFFSSPPVIQPGLRLVLWAIMSEETYGRGQVEWALWCSFACARFNTGDVPRVFRTRIKRLLDIDRDLDLTSAEVPPEIDYAFAGPPAVEGAEAAYRAVDAFCLAIALDLLDSGFKQSEIVFLMRYLRPELEQRFPAQLEPPSLINHQRYRAEDYPNLPSCEHCGQRYADRRLFVVLQKVELTEIIPVSASGRPTRPVIRVPVFCEGATALGAELHETMPDHRRAVTVLELAATAQAVQRWLAEAPAIRRGRPKA